MVSRGRAIALKHGVAAPAHQPLQISLLAAGEEEVVGVGVPEPMWVDLGRVETGHIGADLEPFAYSVGCEPAALTEEQRRAGCMSVVAPLAQVSV